MKRKYSPIAFAEASGIIYRSPYEPRPLRPLPQIGPPPRAADSNPYDASGLSKKPWTPRKPR